MTRDQLKAEIDSAADALGVAPSTVGERAGQGGRFYSKLSDPTVRVWPETLLLVSGRVQQMMAERP
jgi:hypothetical protein